MFLGDTSPKEDLRGFLADRIFAMRKSGQSDLDIRVYLLEQPGVGHPCRGPSEEQLCTTADIDAAFTIAARLARLDEERHRKSLITWKNALVAGAIALAALVVFVPRPKGK